MTDDPADTDPRPLLRRTADQVVRLLTALQHSDMERPTPCADFDVRALGGHVVGVLRGSTMVASGCQPATVPVLTMGAASVLARTATVDRDRMADAWADDGVLDRLLALPSGVMSGREAAVAYGLELTVHAWDLATAVDRTDDLDRPPAAALLPAAAEFVPARPRGGDVPYGPVVHVPAGADPYHRLAGWFGRDPGWTPWAAG